MSTPITARRAQEIGLETIEAGGKVRELDAEHVNALAGYRLAPAPGETHA